MKPTLIILSLLCLGLGYGFYQQHIKSQQRSASAAKLHQSLSNQVSEFRTRLALEHGTSTMTQSNLQYLLDHRTGEWLANSNRLVQIHLLFSNVQHQARAAQTDLEAKAAALVTLEAQREELDRHLDAIPYLLRELAETKNKLTQAVRDRADLAEALGRVRVEKADLERKLEDPVFLQLQTRKAKDDIELRKRLASTGRIDSSDPRASLELRPDGTVRPLPPGIGQSSK